MKNSSGEIVGDEREVCELFNTYFTEIGEKMAQQIPNRPLNMHIETSYNDLATLGVTSTKEMLQYVDALDPAKAAGFDDKCTDSKKL